MFKIRKRIKMDNLIKKKWFYNLESIILFFALMVFSINFFNYDYSSMFHHIADDAYISLQYSYNLWHYGELNYYPGYRVEGYTNFLWTILLSLAYPMKLDPIAFAKFLGYFSGIGLLFFTYKLVENIFSYRLIASLIALALGLNLQIAYMSSWGLETIFYIFLYVTSLYFYTINRLVLASFFFTMAAMTRQEILLLGIILILTDIFFHRNLKRVVLLLSTFVLIFFPYFIIRWMYYGYMLPNTFYVKVSGGGMSIINRGMEYLIYNLSKLNLVILIVTSLILFLVKNRFSISKFEKSYLKSICITIIISTILYSLYIIKVGGDVFNERFIIHYLPLYILCILIFVSYNKSLLFVFSLFITGSLFFTAPTFPNSTHLTGWATLGKYINSISKPGDSLATDAAGALAYYSKLPTYDILGLNDTFIAHKQVKSLGKGVAGHEKQDNQYILDKNPTFITTWIDEDTGAGRGFKEYVDFLLNYELIALLDTSIKEESESRIKVVDSKEIKKEDLLNLIARENKVSGIYDWALYKKKDTTLKELSMKINQFQSALVDKHDMINKDIDIEMNKNENKEGYLLYGPYLKINKGEYNISLDIEAKDISDNLLGNFDIAKNGKVIKEMQILSNNLKNNKVKVNLNFNIEEFNQEDSIEFRFYYFPNSNIKISNIKLSKENFALKSSDKLLLNLNQFQSELINKRDMLNLNDFIEVKKDITKNKGYLLYGPYLNLKNGKYNIMLNIEAKNISDSLLGNFDIVEKGKVVSEMEILSKNFVDDKLILNLDFLIDESGETEFRFYYFPNSDIKISNIRLESK